MEGTGKATLSSEQAKGRNGVVEKNPLASHDEVIKDPIVFWDTLRRFHFIMGTKFMIPVIGGKELDLHVLYVEATKRGGYEKVVAEKKWREVASVFRFSPTTTSASFELRKHCFSLLYHYENLHFFKMKVLLHIPTVALPVNDHSCRSELALVEYSPKPIREFPDPVIEVLGTIYGKFDCGYLVSSVRLAPEVLSGVLYHPGQPGFCSASKPEYNKSLAPYKHGFDSDHSGSGRRRRKRRSGRAGDPSYPKPNRSGYNFFFVEKHYKLKSLYPNREGFQKMIGESWNSLSPEDRMMYLNIGLKDKERYRRELKECKEQLKLRQAVEDERQT